MKKTVFFLISWIFGTTFSGYGQTNYDVEAIKAELKELHKSDQEIRSLYLEAEAKYGLRSKQVDSLARVMIRQDHINIIKVTQILDEFGWLGEEQIGREENQTLFLVIQHAELAVQEKYLPMLKAAVKNGKAKASSLALMEDRVALRQGKKQIYGSQMRGQPENPGIYYVAPLMDPDYVDQRRASVGLGKIADYVKHWNVVWDVEEYKKQLPLIEKWEKQFKF